MLTIQEIKALPPDNAPVCPTLKAMILDISEVEPATAKCKAKFFVILGDETGAISCTVYDIGQKNKFIKGMAVVLVNILIKQSYIAITEKSEVGMCKPFNIPNDVKTSAPKLPGDQEMNIEMALHSPPRTLTNIKGKVISMSPSTTKEIDQDTMKFQDIMMKDKSGKTMVALWDTHADTVEVGALVKMTKCRVKLFNGEKKLSTTRSTNLEVLNNVEDLQDVSDDDDDADSAGTQREDTDMQYGTITSVFEMDPYLSCVNKGCNNTKLITVLENGKYHMQCKNCKGKFSGCSANTYLRATVFFECGNLKKKVAIFQPQLKQLFNSRGIELEVSFDRADLLSKMYDILPIDVKCKLVNNTVRSIIIKRDSEARN